MLRLQTRPERARQNVIPLVLREQPEAVRLRRWVEHLAIPRHALHNARGNAWVRDELEKEFTRLGYRTLLQGPLRNVIALPQNPRGPVTLVAAHYDSVPNCPGADDNGSGLAVMLECARLAARSSPAPGLAFIAFNAEEDGLLGSRDFVANGRSSIESPIAVIHVLEMLGFRSQQGPIQRLPLPFVPESLKRSDFIGLICKGRSNGIADVALRSHAAPELRLVTAKIWGPLHRLVPDIGRSDHLPFWLAGVPAVMWTDTGNFRNPNYHRGSDLPDTLDYDFMREVATLLCSLLPL